MLTNENTDDFEYILHADASGDDGMNLKKQGTSRLYVVACFACSKNSLQQNYDLLLELKRILRCKASDEIKSTTVCRHKSFPAVLQIIEQLEGYINAYVVFKETLTEFTNGKKNSIFWPGDQRSKKFTSFCHAYSVTKLPHAMPDTKFLIVIDNMKKAEIDMTSFMEHELSVGTKTTVKFVDSRSSNYPLLQIADILAGIIRYAFEDYIDVHGYAANKCCFCGYHKRLCNNKPWKLSAPKIATIRPLTKKFFVKKGDRNCLVAGIHFYPERAYDIFKFIDCSMIFRN